MQHASSSIHLSSIKLEEQERGRESEIYLNSPLPKKMVKEI